MINYHDCYIGLKSYALTLMKLASKLRITDLTDERCLQLSWQPTHNATVRHQVL